MNAHLVQLYQSQQAQDNMDIEAFGDEQNGFEDTEINEQFSEEMNKSVHKSLLII